MSITFERCVASLSLCFRTLTFCDDTDEKKTKKKKKKKKKKKLSLFASHVCIYIYIYISNFVSHLNWNF